MFSDLLMNIDGLVKIVTAILLCLIAFFMYLEVAKKPVVKKNKNRKRYKTERTRMEILSALSSDAQTIKTISALTGFAESTVGKYLANLHKKKKVVLIKKGRVYHYVLPTLGQNVYTIRHKSK